VLVLIDTGSAISIISETLAIWCTGVTSSAPTQAFSITGQPMQFLAQKRLSLRLHEQYCMIDFMVMKHCPYSAIVGFDAICQMDLMKVMAWVASSMEQEAVTLATCRDREEGSPKEQSENDDEMARIRSEIKANQNVLPLITKISYSPQMDIDRMFDDLFQNEPQQESTSSHTPLDDGTNTTEIATIEIHSEISQSHQQHVE